MARPTKLSPEVQEQIVRAIRSGNYPEVAARHAGLHPATYYRWMERGALQGDAPEDNPYRQFRAEVERALADSEAAVVGLLFKSARDGDTRAATWLLERRFSERWARRERLEHVEVTDEDEASKLDGEIERLLAEMAEREHPPS